MRRFSGSPHWRSSRQMRLGRVLKHFTLKRFTNHVTFSECFDLPCVDLLLFAYCESLRLFSTFLFSPICTCIWGIEICVWTNWTKTISRQKKSSVQFSVLAPCTCAKKPQFMMFWMTMLTMFHHLALLSHDHIFVLHWQAHFETCKRFLKAWRVEQRTRFRTPAMKIQK